MATRRTSGPGRSNAETWRRPLLLDLGGGSGGAGGGGPPPGPPGEPPEVGPGARLGRFELIRELGHGSVGVTYLGRDLDLGRSVAIKVASSRPTSFSDGATVSREVEALARLQAPGILPLWDVGAADGRFWFVRDHLEGESLDHRLERGPVPLPEAILTLEKAARATGLAHASGLVHGGLKPANLFLAGPDVWVLDFGVARLLGVRGSGGRYEPAEVRAGERGDARSDVFALGAILAELLGCGRPGLAWPGLPRRTPRGLARLVARCLAECPEDRPRDGVALADALLVEARWLRPPRSWLAAFRGARSPG